MRPPVGWAARSLRFAQSGSLAADPSARRPRPSLRFGLASRVGGQVPAALASRRVATPYVQRLFRSPTTKRRMRKGWLRPPKTPPSFGPSTSSGLRTCGAWVPARRFSPTRPRHGLRCARASRSRTRSGTLSLVAGGARSRRPQACAACLPLLRLPGPCPAQRARPRRTAGACSPLASTAWATVRCTVLKKRGRFLVAAPLAEEHR